MAVRPQHGNDLTVGSFDRSDRRGAGDGAWRITFRKQLPAASARDRECDAPASDRRLAVSSEEQKLQIGTPEAAFPRALCGMVAELGIVKCLRFSGS